MMAAGTGITDDVAPRNIGSVGVNAFQVTEQEISTGRGLNDSIQTAQFLPLGTGPGQQNTIDVTGALPLFTTIGLTGTLPEDVDYYSFDLLAGDILDIAGIGSIGGIDVFFSNGQRWFAFEANQAFLYPANSPLMDTGNVVAAQVVPTTGRYFIRLASSSLGATNYTLGLRVYRPVLEQQPIGTKQKVFLDFDGATIASSVFTPGIPGTVRIPSLLDSLNLVNLEPQNESAFIDRVIAETQERFRSVASLGGNGDFATTGVPGQFAIEILNSRDHADPGDDPFVTRALIGGTTADIQIAGILGISQSIDVGNFDPSEIVLLPVEFFEAAALAVPRSNFVSVFDAIATRLGTTIAHEIGHSIGLYHTDPLSLIPSIIDQGGTPQANAAALGVGPDGIFGTADDVEIVFPVLDRFVPNEGFIGNEYVAASVAWVLSTGKGGTTVSGVVYSDINQNGQLNNGETGIPGVTVFVDNDNDGVLDPGETSTVTSSTGAYTLPVSSGSRRIVAVAPTSFSGTSSAQTVTVGSTGLSNVNLGLTRVSTDITGTVFADLDGNGIRDAGEPVSQGVTVYLDLDGDNRSDIGEPSAVTDSNGNYKINFPGPGTYTIREVLPVGFEQTFPFVPQSSIILPTGQTPDEHRVVFDGTSLNANFNFGNRPNLDFGDAPDSYRTLLASGGPSHSILAGLSLGGAPDREIDGKPSVGADGDDLVGAIGGAGTVVDDEDGVTVLTPIGPGSTATFQVNLNNTTGNTGYLQAWFDFNQNGSFADPGEHVIVNSTATGTVQFPVAIPASTRPGTLYSRFRYSLVQGVGIGGQVNSGEVEDHLFTVNPTAKLANDDTFELNRNSQANVLNVLGNDFETATNPLTITSVNVLGTPATRGVVTVATGGRAILYTPPIGFTGRDSFTYTVTSASGQTATATVVVNVSFVSQSPIAVDDSFEVAEGSTNIPLNVLDNDVPSRFGGVTIISVTPGSQGGTARPDGGNQAIRYTPRAGFNGTEEFIYSITDGSGNVSSATVTVNLLPGSRNDDLVSYTIKFFDPLNTTREITNVQAGQEFLARVFVEDLRAPIDNRGVFSGFLDLLYSDELVSPLPSTVTPNFNFDITFGSTFRIDAASGTATTPGLFDEVGSVRVSDVATPNQGPIELFTVKMQATAPGIAVFKGNPADVAESETTVFNLQAEVTTAQQRFGISELTISPSGTVFTTAIDDSFLNAIDSNGQLIRAGVPATLNVVGNDILGPTGILDSVTILRAPGFGGTAVVGSDGRTIIYTPGGSVNDLDSFSYAIVTADGVRSSAEVSVTVGNAAANDTLDVSLRIVDGSGNPIVGNIAVGTRFGVQYIVQDIRADLATSQFGVFASFSDILYNANLAIPSDTILGDQFNFDVVFGPIFGAIDPTTGLVAGAFGVASAPGIIDEFGSFVADANVNGLPVDIARTPLLLATLFFEATAPGRLEFKTNPADALPQRESLFFLPDAPVPVNQIRFGVTSVTIGGASGEGEAFHNAVNPADVNDDGRISPLDALSVINQISSNRRAEGESASTIKRFADVTGDGIVTPLDALHVINTISRNRKLTSPVEEQPQVTTPTLPVESYLLLQELRSRMAASFLASPPTTPLANTTGAEGSGPDDSEEDEDVVDLLARDISNVWQ